MATYKLFHRYKSASYKTKRVMLIGSIGLAAAILAIFSSIGVSGATPSGYQLISANKDDPAQVANGWSRMGVNEGGFSADGNVVVFRSNASDLVEGDTNGKFDIFAKNIRANTIQRVNVSSTGAQDDGDAYFNAVSETGRYIVYQSNGTTLEGPQGGGSGYFVYVHDMKTGENFPVPTQMNAAYVITKSISNDGRFLIANAGWNFTKIVAYDRAINAWTDAAPPSIYDSTSEEGGSASCDGSLIVFTSQSPNLVPNDTNNGYDVFLVDMRAGYKVTSLTKNITGSSMTDARISCNGRYITFKSDSNAIVSSPAVNTPNWYYMQNYYRYDRINGTFSLVDQTTEGNQMYAATVRQVADSGEVLFDAAYQPYDGGNTRYYVRNEENQTTMPVVDPLTGYAWFSAYAPVSSPNESGMNIAGADNNLKVLATWTQRTDIIPNDNNSASDVFVGKLEY